MACFVGKNSLADIVEIVVILCNLVDDAHEVVKIVLLGSESILEMIQAQDEAIELRIWSSIKTVKSTFIFSEEASVIDSGICTECPHGANHNVCQCFRSLFGGHVRLCL